MPKAPRDDAFIAERVSLPRSNCQHAVVFNRNGQAIEVRSYPGAKWANNGPAKLGAGWQNRGRLTWSDTAPITATARCAINMAITQIAERRKAREGLPGADATSDLAETSRANRP